MTPQACLGYRREARSIEAPEAPLVALNSTRLDPFERELGTLDTGDEGLRDTVAGLPLWRSVTKTSRHRESLVAESK
jgi:hypothetical protein